MTPERVIGREEVLSGGLSDGSAVVTALPAPLEKVRRIVYFGTPQVARRPLRALCSAGYHITLVVTRPPRRRTRRGGAVPSPVESTARGLRLPVANRLDDPAVAAAALGADLGVVVAYGQLIRAPLLQSLAMVNMHFSLLPRWRGAAPVERAILAGDAETGVCLMQVAPELDAGSVYRQVATPVGAHETADQLRERLCGMGTEMLLNALAEGLGEPVAQSGDATYAEKITPAELRIRWDAPAEQVHRLVRVGGAWTTFRGRRLKVLETRWRSRPAAAGSAAAEPVTAEDGADSLTAPAGLVSTRGAEVTVTTGYGLLQLRRVQSAGRAPVAATAWRNGARIAAGERLGP